MKSIKLLVLVFTAITLSQCNTVKLTETAPFTITGASYYNWVGGQPGVRGTNLIIGINNNSKITVQSIYFKNRIHKPSLEARNGKDYLVVNINTSRTLKFEEKKSENSKRIASPAKPAKLPFSLEKNEAVIKYLNGKKTA